MLSHADAFPAKKHGEILVQMLSHLRFVIPGLHAKAGAVTEIRSAAVF